MHHYPSISCWLLVWTNIGGSIYILALVRQYSGSAPGYRQTTAAPPLQWPIGHATAQLVHGPGSPRCTATARRGNTPRQPVAWLHPKLKPGWASGAVCTMPHNKPHAPAPQPCKLSYAQNKTKLLYLVPST